jgi:hypothetical protein
LDNEAIEAVLDALQSDDLTKVRGVRPGRTRSARVAVSTLASLATVSGGAAAVGALAGSVESMGATLLDDGSAVALSASGAHRVPPPDSVPATDAVSPTTATEVPASGDS